MAEGPEAEERFKVAGLRWQESGGDAGATGAGLVGAPVQVGQSESKPELVVESEEERGRRLEREEAKRQRQEWLRQKAEREAWWESIKHTVAPVVGIHRKPTGDIMGPCNPPPQFESKLGPYRFLGKGASF